MKGGSEALLAALLLAGCATAPVNPPLAQVDPSSGYRLETLALGPGNSEETFFIVAFSGGGVRAAALDFGVLRELAGVQLPGGSLLDELDLLSSSSMASVVAAYYGLHGQQAFLERFEEEVLTARMQSAYKRKLLAPWQWPRLWSNRFGRSELAQAYLERHLFHGATYADMPRTRPLVLLGATDMTLGEQFIFTQGQFDRLCSELDEVTVARAVTASLAFTGAFTPVAFRNYPNETCGYSTPEVVETIHGEGPLAGVRRFERARAWRSYEDEGRRWIHLVDGGVADNIGMRSIKLALTSRGVPWSVLDRIEDGTIRRVVILIVDARAAVSLDRDQRRRAPRLGASVLTSASSPLANYSTETIEVVSDFLGDLAAAGEGYRETLAACERIAEDACAAGEERQACLRSSRSHCREALGVDEASRPPDPEVHFINVRLDLIEDGETRTRLSRLPTSLQLPAEDVGLLIEAAGSILRASPDYQRLLADLGAAGD